MQWRAPSSPRPGAPDDRRRGEVPRRGRAAPRDGTAGGRRLRGAVLAHQLSESTGVLLAAEGLGRRVEGRWLWRDVALEVDAGARLGVAGRSGSGKSQLLRTLVGLEAADEGRVTRHGRRVERPGPELRAAVLYLHQEPAFREGSVADDLAQVRALDVHAGRDGATGEEWLERLGRAELAGRDVSVLSGGERKLVALARGLQLAPEVLLLDEPTAGLDRESAEAVVEALAGWLDEGPPRAWVWVAHEADELDGVSDRVLRLEPPAAEEGRAPT